MPEPAGNRPALLFYCQHSLGIGHLVRALTLCEALAARYQVTLVSGGVFPRELSPPAGMEVVYLPAIRAGSDFRLVAHDPSVDVEEMMEQRRRALLDCFRAVRPAVVVIELYPFGRKKFGSEIRPLLEEARFEPRPLLVCSLRDLVVSKDGSDGFRDQAVDVANDYFDAILVHTDPRVIPVPELGADALPLSTPVLSTGFVTPARRPQSPLPDKRLRVVVSAGGGAAGESLLRCAMEAQPQIWARAGLAMRIITGPLTPPDLLTELEEAALQLPGLELLKFVPDLLAELEIALVSVSQCGYNTALDVIRARARAVLVPVEAEGDEQLTRARRLEELGLVHVLTPDHLCPETLADAICEAASSSDPPTVDIDLGGAAATCDLIVALERRHGSRDRRPTVAHWLEPLRTVLEETT
ncbi:MAG TPA: glycosyltransferase, partial [Acidimicrobiales bacterium]|nr:glycosyltransferase [Acidimicrobiales bacterium]